MATQRPNLAARHLKCTVGDVFCTQFDILPFIKSSNSRKDGSNTQLTAIAFTVKYWRTDAKENDARDRKWAFRLEHLL